MNSRVSRIYLLLFLLTALCPLSLFAQSTGAQQEKPQRILTLSEAIHLAREYSSEAMLAKHQLRAAYWQYRTYKAEFLPGVRLSGVLPDFNRRLVRIQLADGSFRYVPEFANTMNLALSVDQKIGWTGTSIFVKSSLDRTDIFGERRSTEYMALPVQIGLRQSIFGVNELKWSKRIEPLLYEEAQRSYVVALEQISGEACNLFFQCVLAEQELELAQFNRANADTLYKIALGRYNVGTIAENDLLQMELNYLNAGQSVNESEVNLQLRRFRLISYLGLNDTYDWRLAIPDTFPRGEVDLDAALVSAQERHPDMVGYARQQQQAKYRVRQAQAQRGFAADLGASFGLTQQAPTFLDAYRNPREQFGVQLNVSIPILDWGKGKGRVRMAQSNYEMTETNIARAKLEFWQDVYLQVMRYQLQEDQLALAAKADTIARNRYRIAKERFLIGKIDVLELDKAQVDRDQARTGYIRAMQQYWQVYYALRALALLDPTTGEAIDAEFDPLLQ